MEVEESDTRKPRGGRKSRNNSGNTKDPKTDITKGTNGDAERKEPKINDLPNGDEAVVDRVQSEENTGDSAGEENNSSPMKLNTSSSISEIDVEGGEADVSIIESTNGDESYIKCVSQRAAHVLDSDEDFMGFDANEEADRNTGLHILQSLIGKFEMDISDDELTEEEREYFRQTPEFSDLFWSETSSPTKMDGMADALGVDDICSSNASSPSVASGFSGDAKPRKKSQHVDLSNPAYRKPLDMGWKRELVFRKMADQSQKRQADVYYYTPTGKKVRSAREVAEHLTGTDLSDENFTFFKRALGLNDPTKEIIRDAKLRESSGTPPQKIPKLPKVPKIIGTDGIPKGVGVAKDENVGTPKIVKNFSRGSFPRIKVTPVRSNQTPSPGRPKALGRPKKDSLALAEGELEIGMLPPSWKEPTAVSGARKVTPPSSSLLSKSQGSGRPPSKEDGFVGVPMSSESHFMQFFMQNVSVGYSALHHVFQYLKVHELLRAGRVCRMWHDLAGHRSLWRTVRMKNSQVLDWDGCTAMLSRHGTRHLDLRKMLLDPTKTQDVWSQFCTAIGRIASLHHLDLCRCPCSVVERVATQCPQLTNLTALFLSDPHLDLRSLKSLGQMKELRLKGVNGLKLRTSLDVLTKMTNLRHLSLTTVKDLGKANPENLKTLTNLESLELGECSDFSEEFGSSCLPCLTKLTRLRLEMGQMKCPTFIILNGVHSLPLLTHLELVNFDIKPGFDKALAQCKNIKRLLLIPTYLSQSATTNHMVLGGVTKLSESLVQFVWGVTHELLHVTELFVDQCEGQKVGAPKGGSGAGGGDGGGKGGQQPSSGKKSGTNDSIPILRPVPGRDILSAGSDFKPEEDDTSKPSPQVDILPLSQLQKLLATSLPNTKVSILKIPFHATWRQTLGESNL